MRTQSVRVIIVDDDPEFRDLIREYLVDEGFDIAEAQDGEAMWALISERIPDAVLLDVKLPGEDGLSLSLSLRKDFPDMGIVMISGKEDVVDRVAGLEVGADDYIVKPFHLRELLARIRSVLRRRDISGNSPAGPAESQTALAGTGSRQLLCFSGWILDSEQRILTSPDGELPQLTGGEFDLLVAFASHPKRALTREQLLDYSRSRDAEAFDRSIDVQVGRLRRKIEQDPKRPALIKTVRNVGYMFGADVTLTNG